MEYVTIGGVKFNLPFIADERPFTAAEREELKESISKHGVIVCIVCRKEDRKPGQEEMVVVGATRTQVAAELGLLDIPKSHRSFKTMEDAREFNRQTSLRRHYTREEQVERRAARVKKVVELRTEGKSERTIAETVGVSTAQVHRDLETAGASGEAPATPNGKVTGSNGVQQPATKPKTPVIRCDSCARAIRVGYKAKPKCPDCKKARDAKKLSEGTAADLAETPEEPAEPPTIEQVISRENSELEKWAKSLLALIDTIPDAPWLKDLDRKASAIKSIKNVADTIRSAKCYRPCPLCQGEGCEKCYKSGRVTRYAHQQMV